MDKQNNRELSRMFQYSMSLIMGRRIMYSETRKKMPAIGILIFLKFLKNMEMF